MKSETSAFDLFFIVRELQKLKDAKLEKVFHTKDNKNSILFRFYSKDNGRLFLKLELPNQIYFTQHKEEYDKVSGFGMFLRRHLQSTRLIKINQNEFDRVLDLTFEIRKKGVTSINHVIIELFGTGNLVLINEENKILGLLYSQRWKDRQILPGKTYIFPQAQFNPLESDFSTFVEQIKKSSKSLLVAILASDISLGGEYAEELCARAKIDKNKELNSLTDDDFKKLFDEIEKIKNEKISGIVYEKTVTPFKFLTSGEEKENHDSFCLALDEKLTQKKNVDVRKEVESKSSSKLNKIENVLKKQNEMILKITINADIFQKQGEKIYENYPKLTIIINELNSLRKTNEWKEIKNIFKEKYPYVKLNEKNNEIVVDVE